MKEEKTERNSLGEGQAPLGVDADKVFALHVSGHYSAVFTLALRDASQR